MPQQQTLSAKPTKLGGINLGHAGHKVRVAGRMLQYDERTMNMILLDGNAGLLVDVSLDLDSWSTSEWLRERLSPIMVIGYVEGSDTGYSIPKCTIHGRMPQIDDSVMLKALLVMPVPDLDLANWNAGIDLLDGGR